MLLAAVVIGALRVNRHMNVAACFYRFQLTHCILVDSSTVICWTSPYVMLGGQVCFVAYILFFDGKSC